MSDGVNREKVLQTTKVRTSLKSDLSWIHKKETAAEDTKSSEGEAIPPSPRSLSSYVLMTTKKFEPDNFCELNGKHLEPVSLATTAKQNDNAGPESTENGVAASENNNPVTKVSSVEEMHVNGSSVDKTDETNLLEQENCKNTENLIIHDVTTKEETAPNEVPDILADTMVISSTLQANSSGHQAETGIVLDILSNSLIEPILNIETKEAEANSISETVADQSVLESAVETLLNGIASTEENGEDTAEIPKGPQNDALTSAHQGDNAADTGTSSAEIPAAVNDVEPVKDSEVVETSKEQNSSADSPQDCTVEEPSSTSTKDDTVQPAAASADSADDKAEPGKTEASEEAPAEPEVSDISVSSSDLIQNSAESQEPPSKSTEGDAEEPTPPSADVSEVQNSVESVKETVEGTSTVSSEEPQAPQSAPTESEIPRDEDASGQGNVEPVIVEAAEENVEVPELPSTIAEDAVAQEILNQDTEEAEAAEGKEVIVDQNVPEAISLETQTKSPEEDETTTAENTNTAPESECPLVQESDISKGDPATSPEESPNCSSTMEASDEGPKENAECRAPAPALIEVNQDETYKAEPAEVVSSPEGTVPEVEETNNAVTEEESAEDLAVNSVTVTEAKAQAEAEAEVTPAGPIAPEVLFDIHDALEKTPSDEQSKGEEDAAKPTNEEVTTAVNESDEAKDTKEELPADNNSVSNSVEEEETTPASFITRDGREVCSHCDQFIGLMKLTFSYPPMYLHPECLKCGVCSKVLGDLLTPMFEHKQLIYCSGCYDEVSSLY